MGNSDALIYGLTGTLDRPAFYTNAFLSQPSVHQGDATPILKALMLAKLSEHQAARLAKDNEKAKKND